MGNSHRWFSHEHLHWYFQLPRLMTGGYVILSPPWFLEQNWQIFLLNHLQVQLLPSMFRKDVSIISIQEFMNLLIYIYIFVTSQFSRCISWLSQFYKSNVFPCFPMFSWWNRCGEKCFQQLRCATMKARSPPSSGGRMFSFLRWDDVFVWWLPSGK